MDDSHYMIVTAQTRYETEFSLEQTAEMTGMHPDMILELVRVDLVQVLRGSSAEAPQFDEFAIARLRHIEHLREHEKLSLRAVSYIVRLLDQLNAADQELRELRERLR